LVTDSPDLESALAASLSKVSGFELLERTALSALTREVAVAGGPLKIDGADFVLVVERQPNSRYSARLSDALTGAVFQSFSSPPDLEPALVAEWLSLRLRPWAAPAGIKRKVSLLGLRFETDSEAHRQVERSLNLSLTAALQESSGTVVLERWKLNDLLFEKELLGETTTANSLEALQQPAFELADKVSALLSKQNSSFRIPIVTREERIARLKKNLEGKNLPSVLVTISEQDFGRRSVDPAVETEFKKSLLELGFEVIDPQGTKVADVLIKGEAFSETAARRGQLVSARARAEIQATRSKDNQVLAADRETTSAVDTAPATAGKSALQNAGLILLERTVPKIVAP